VPPLREVLIVYAAVGIATAGLGALRDVGGLSDAVHLAISAVFLGVAMRMARREPDGPKRMGIDLAGLLEPTPDTDDRAPGPLGLFDLARAVRAALPSALRETGFALAIAAIVFPPFVVGFWAFHGPTHTFTWALPDDLASFALSQLVLVGLPEEALFRGYVQTRLTDAWPATRKLLGANVSVPALLAQAALFAIVHLATEPSLDKLAVFFPGLLFGWMRARRGGIGAAIVFHALSNVLAEILVRGWL
jgi:membrane protease YdiL (CAAX protease family)